MPKTSHVKNRPFDFKLIDLVEPNHVLYLRQKGLSTYHTLKMKNEIWSNIAKEMNTTADFCLMRWNNLRGQFQKEFRRCREICPKTGQMRDSTWPYLERLSFLECTLKCNRTKAESVRKKKKESIDTEDNNEVDIPNLVDTVESVDSMYTISKPVDTLIDCHTENAFEQITDLYENMECIVNMDNITSIDNIDCIEEAIENIDNNIETIEKDDQIEHIENVEEIHSTEIENIEENIPEIVPNIDFMITEEYIGDVDDMIIESIECGPENNSMDGTTDTEWYAVTQTSNNNEFENCIESNNNENEYEYENESENNNNDNDDDNYEHNESDNDNIYESDNENENEDNDYNESDTDIDNITVEALNTSSELEFDLEAFSNEEKYQIMENYLDNIDSDEKESVERRIMAFLCKVQLRALNNEDIDDLSI